MANKSNTTADEFKAPVPSSCWDQGPASERQQVEYLEWLNSQNRLDDRGKAELQRIKSNGLQQPEVNPLQNH